MKTALPKSLLKGLRVLFLPKSSRTSYFRSFLETVRQREAWELRVVCAEQDRKIWRYAVADDECFYSAPDFGQAEDWERNTDRIAEIDSFIAECERATGISAARIIIAGECDIGRGFSKPIYYLFHSQIARNVMRDNGEPFRVVRRMFAFARTVLEAARPDLLIGGGWADPMCFTFYLVAQRLGVSCAVNRHSKVWLDRCYWSADPLMYNEATRMRAAELRARNAPVSDRAREHIAAFRAEPKTLRYMQANGEASDRGERWRALHAHFVTLAWVGLRHRIQRRHEQPPKPTLKVAWDCYRRAFLKWRQAKLLRRLDNETLRDMRYVFIALHKDPGYALNYQAPFWFNQSNTVSLLTSALPAGYRLLVREHRDNAGRRPTRYYKELARLPGVVLIDGFDDQFKYSANADLIVTDNGSTGWEGLLLGRPVITLADTFYDAAGLAHRLRDPESLAAKVVELVNQTSTSDVELYDKALGWLLDAEWDNSAETGEAGYSATLDLLADLYAEQGWHAAHQDPSTA